PAFWARAARGSLAVHSSWQDCELPSSERTFHRDTGQQPPDLVNIAKFAVAECVAENDQGLQTFRFLKGFEAVDRSLGDAGKEQIQVGQVGQFLQALVRDVELAEIQRLQTLA